MNIPAKHAASPRTVATIAALVAALSFASLVRAQDVTAQTPATVPPATGVPVPDAPVAPATKSAAIQPGDVQPMLRIDTGTHSALVRSLLWTPDGKQLISVGQDKTVRFWNLQTGQTRVLRFKIAVGGTGLLRAATLDKSGRFLAIAVKSDAATITERPDRQKSDDVLLVDLQTEKITRIPTELSLLPTLAFSPDGTRLAVSGIRRGRFGQVRVFDVSGIGDPKPGKNTAVSLVTEFPRAVMDEWVSTDTVESPAFLTLMDSITFDPNGNYIAAGNRYGTVRVFDAKTGAVKHYGKNAVSLTGAVAQDFARGRQVRTVSWVSDGANFAAPDGLILVGVEDQLYAWNVATGVFTKEAGGNQITALAASYDGKNIAYGVGGNRVGVGYPVMFWNRGKPALTPTKLGEHPGTVTAVALDVRTDPETGLPVRRVAAADERGNLSVWNVDTQEKIADYATQVIPFRTVRWSVDGSTIGWTTDPGMPVTPRYVGAFDFNSVLPVTEPETVKWQASPSKKVARLFVKNRGVGRVEVNNAPNGSTVEVLSGEDVRLRTITFAKGENVLCAVLASSTAVIAGTNSGIALYDITDTTPKVVRRFVGYEGLPVDVSVAPNGKRFAAVSGDGTVRLWSLETPATPTEESPKAPAKPVAKIKKDTVPEAAPLLSLFVCADGEWVAWNDATGYYAASPRGDMRIGWHINKGDDQFASWCNADQLRETRFSPDAVRVMFATNRMVEPGTGEPSKMDAVATVATIPEVRIIAVDGATPDEAQPGVYVTKEPNISVTATLTNAATTGELFWSAERIAGGAARRTEVTGQAVTDGEQKLAVSGLRPGINRVRVVAKSATGAESKPQFLSVNYDAPKVERKPNLYALCIGVSDYTDSRSFRKLPYTDWDATEVADVFAAQKGTLYGNVTIDLVTDKRTTKAGIDDAFDKLSKRISAEEFAANPDDLVVVFIASHGDYGFVKSAPDATPSKDRQFFLVPSDAQVTAPPGKPDDAVFTNVESWNGLMNKLSDLPAQNVVLLIDHCHSGGASDALQSAQVRSARNIAARDLPRRNFVSVTAATASEVSWENDEWGHGAFTFALLKALRGQFAVARDGRIRLDRVFPDVFDEVRSLTGAKGVTQTPTKFVPVGASDNITLTLLARPSGSANTVPVGVSTIPPPAGATQK